MVTPYNLFFYVWLLVVALPGGAAIGWSTGWLMKRALRQGQRSVLISLLDAMTGIAGFVLGAFLSAMSTSFLYEEWSNGKLVSRRTDGFADYLHLFAILGAVVLVVIVRLSASLVRKLIGKTSIRTDQRVDAKV